MILLVLALAGGGAALYYFKFRKPKADTTGHDGVLVICALKILKTDFVRKIYCSTVISKSQQKLALILNEC